jgi:hypothetical protein
MIGYTDISSCLIQILMEIFAKASLKAFDRAHSQV